LKTTGVQTSLTGRYDELKKWGRFEVVADRSKADIILVFSLDKGSYTYLDLTLLDSKTGESLYEDKKLWRWQWSNPTRDAIQELRKRIEEQENHQRRSSPVKSRNQVSIL
jgi:hypothetical protein